MMGKGTKRGCKTPKTTHQWGHGHIGSWYNSRPDQKSIETSHLKAKNVPSADAVAWSGSPDLVKTEYSDFCMMMFLIHWSSCCSSRLIEIMPAAVTGSCMLPLETAVFQQCYIVTIAAHPYMLRRCKPIVWLRPGCEIRLTFFTSGQNSNYKN